MREGRQGCSTTDQGSSGAGGTAGLHPRAAHTPETGSGDGSAAQRFSMHRHCGGLRQENHRDWSATRLTVVGRKDAIEDIQVHRKMHLLLSKSKHRGRALRYTDGRELQLKAHSTAAQHLKSNGPSSLRDEGDV